MHGMVPISSFMKQFIIVILQSSFKTDNRFGITVLECGLKRLFICNI